MHVLEVVFLMLREQVRMYVCMYALGVVYVSVL